MNININSRSSAIDSQSLLFNRFLSRVFTKFFLSLFVSFLVAVFSKVFVGYLLYSPFPVISLVFCYFISSILFDRAISHQNLPQVKFHYYFASVLMGIILSPMFFYRPDILIVALLLSCLFFGSLITYALTTKSDLSIFVKVFPFLIFIAVVLCIVSWVSILFFKVSVYTMILPLFLFMFGLILVGYTASVKRDFYEAVESNTSYPVILMEYQCAAMFSSLFANILMAIYNILSGEE